jgi:hypothetical protein
MNMLWPVWVTVWFAHVHTKYSLDGLEEYTSYSFTSARGDSNHDYYLHEI